MQNKKMSKDSEKEVTNYQEAKKNLTTAYKTLELPFKLTRSFIYSFLEFSRASTKQINNPEKNNSLSREDD